MNIDLNKSITNDENRKQDSQSHTHRSSINSKNNKNIKKQQLDLNNNEKVIENMNDANFQDLNDKIKNES